MTATNASWAKSVSGDWTVAANWAGGVVPGISGATTSADTASLLGIGPYTVTVGTTSAWSIGSVTVGAYGATLEVGTGGLAVSTGITLSSGTLLLGGMLEGGTVAQQGGTLAVQSGSYSAALNTVTVQGTFDLSGAGLRLALEGTNAFLNSAGTRPGRVVLTGSGTTLSVGDTETLDAFTLAFGSTSGTAATLQLGSYFAQTLTLGSGANVNVSGDALISNLAQTVTKQVVNDGVIGIASGAVLEVGTQVQLVSGGVSGALLIQSGGTLQLDGSYTTGGLRSLVTGDSGAVVVTGLLDNSGAALTLAPIGTAGAMPSLTLEGGTLKGGTLKLAGGTLNLVSGNAAYTPTPSTLDGVTVQGTLSLAATAGTVPAVNDVLLRDGITFQGLGQGASGSGPGALLLTGAGQALLASDAETLDNVAVKFGNAQVATTIGSTGSGTFAFGKHATVAVQGQARIAGGTFTNNGAMQVASGARLQVTAGTALGTSTGTLTLAAGGTLELDGTETTAALAALVTTGGGVVELDGMLNNAGQVLAVQPGPFGALLLRGGTIQGGTVRLAGGSFQLAGSASGGTSPTLSGVALQGTLDLSQPMSGLVGTYVGLTGGVTYAGAGGTGQGAILLTGSSNMLLALDQETLANVAVTLGSAAGTAATADVLGTATAGGFTLAGGSTLTVAGPAQVAGSGGFANKGAIQINVGARLDIGAGVVLGASTGTTTVAAGGTLALDGNLATATLLGLGLGGAGTVALDGTLNNAGSTLQLVPAGTAPSPALQSLTLEGGTIQGGTLVLNGGALLTSVNPNATNPQPATLAGVTVVGALDLRLPHAGAAAPLELRGTVFEGAGGSGPGSILLTGQGQSVLVGDSETLGGVAVTLGGRRRAGRGRGQRARARREFHARRRRAGLAHGWHDPQRGRDHRREQPDAARGLGLR